MKLDFDSQSLDFSCSGCGKKISEKIGRLKNDPKITCSCGVVTQVNAEELRKGLVAAQKAADDLGRKLGKLFK